MIVHTYIGFDSEDIPTKEGIDNFARVVEEADKLNVKIAFENTEGEEYLKAVMDAFSHCDNVGFCWDSGHEMCPWVHTHLQFVLHKFYLCSWLIASFILIY